jgi:hypothetical protein
MPERIRDKLSTVAQPAALLDALDA